MLLDGLVSHNKSLKSTLLGGLLSFSHNKSLKWMLLGGLISHNKSFKSMLLGGLVTHNKLFKSTLLGGLVTHNKLFKSTLLGGLVSHNKLLSPNLLPLNIFRLDGFLVVIMWAQNLTPASEHLTGDGWRLAFRQAFRLLQFFSWKIIGEGNYNLCSSRLSVFPLDFYCHKCCITAGEFWFLPSSITLTDFTHQP